MYVRVDIRPSRLLRLARIGLHCMALCSVLWIDLNMTLRLVIGALVVANFLRAMRTPWQGPDAILFIDGHPRLLFGDHVVEVDLQEQYYSTTFLLVLYFRERRSQCEGGATTKRLGLFPSAPPVCNDYHIVMLPDSTNARSHRQLRMLLRWHKVHVQSAITRSCSARHEL